MRIDMLKPQPVPEVPKVSENSSPSVSYDNEYRQNVKKQADSLGSGKVGSNQNKRDKSDDQTDMPAGSRRKIQFKIHHNPNEVITQIVDGKSGDVVDEIPPEKTLDTLQTFPNGKGNSLDKTV